MVIPRPREQVCKYKHITWRSTPNQSGWVVQAGGRTHGGFHKSVKAACVTLRSALKLKKTDQLPLRASSSTSSADSASRAAHAPRNRLYGVSYHRRLKRWVGNQCPLGATYKTAAEAHAALCKVLKRPAAALPRGQKRQLTPVNTLQRLQCLQLYGEGGTAKYLPADLTAAYRHMSISADMFEDDPSLLGVSLSLKYGPWKDALFSAWKERKKLRSGNAKRQVPLKKLPLPDRADELQKIISAAALLISKKPVELHWPRNANRFRHREQGPTKTLLNLGIVNASTLNVDTTN